MDRSAEATRDHELIIPPLEPGLVAENGADRDTPLLAISRLLWSRRRALARAAMAGLALGSALALLLPVRYTAVSRLMPPDTQNSSGMALLAAIGSKAGLPIGMTTDLLGVKSSGALFVGVLHSRTVQDRLINRFDLRREYWRKTYEDTREKLESRTNISEDRKTGIITIRVSDPSPQRAAALAQAYVDELDRLVAELTTSAAHRERVFLEQRLQVVKKELDEASAELSQFSSKNATIDLKEQGRAIVQSAAALQGQLIAAQSELRGLEEIYTDSNVRVRSARARVAELQRQLEKIGGKDATAFSTADQLYPSIRQLPLVGLKYIELYRRAKIQETVFETLTQQYELAKVQEAKEIPSVRVLDIAQPPEKKSFPPRMLITLLGGLLSFLLTAALVVLAQLWSEIDPEERHKAFLTEIWGQTSPVLTRGLLPVRSRCARLTHSWQQRKAKGTAGTG